MANIDPKATPSLELMKERATEAYSRLMAAANGRELEVEYPHWKLRDNATAPLSFEERGYVLRWQFLGGGVDSITRADGNAGENEALAQAYIRVDAEIGPVHIVIAEDKVNVIFKNGVARDLTAPERASVNNYLGAVEAYRRSRASRA